MTERAAASKDQTLARQRDQIETLAISVRRIQRRPDPDARTLRRIVSKAMKLLATFGATGAGALPEPVVAFVAGSSSERDAAVVHLVGLIALVRRFANRLNHLSRTVSKRAPVTRHKRCLPHRPS